MIDSVQLEFSSKNGSSAATSRNHNRQQQQFDNSNLTGTTAIVNTNPSQAAYDEEEVDSAVSGFFFLVFM